jgi:hypothetical protein
MVIGPDNPLYDFYGPFHRTREGRIFVLASPDINIRDGLAATQIGRCFPIPEYERVVVEPSTPTVFPAENIIFVGSTPPYAGREPLPMDARLRERLERIQKESRYQFAFVEQEVRAVEDQVAGKRYVPGRTAGRHRDFGVIRRVNHSPSEFTVTLGGVHLLGTLGATKLATSAPNLQAIWQALHELDGFVESRPVEILVRSTYDSGHSADLYTLSNIEATALAISYNRHWVFDMAGDRRWVDQAPWDIHVCVRGAREWQLAGAGAREPVPRVEIEADLSELDSEIRGVCENVFSHEGRGAAADEVDHLLETLLAESDRFRIRLCWSLPAARSVTCDPLGPGPSARETASLRKRFFVHLALCRFLGRPLLVEAAAIRHFYPTFKPASREGKLVSEFKKDIRGRLRESGFLLLLGEPKRRKDYMHIDHAEDGSAYTLRLDRAALELKLRF